MARHSGARACARVSIVVVLFFCAHASVAAQTTRGATSHVPFVGCESDGQSGPVTAPRGKEHPVDVSPQEAGHLAYYEASDGGLGVLAPRGWHCFNTYGSNGATLYVSPSPISAKQLLAREWAGFPGPAIQVSMMNGDTSGRFDVARVIARVFPAHMDFVDGVIAEGMEPASAFPRGPYPTDKLVYRSKEVVEYVTPANTEGMGTRSRLRKNADSIEGVAILFGGEPNALHLSMRLPTEMRSLAPIIIREVEHEASK